MAGKRTKLRRFRGQVALVVGGAQGIGKAIALRLADEGARVVIGDVDRRELLRTGREMSGQGLDVRTVVSDVCKPRQVERMVAGIIRLEKKIDVLMYVAGVGREAPV